MMTLNAPAKATSGAATRPVLPQVALKVQRRKYATNAVDELALRRRIGSDHPWSRFVLDCAEVFVYDGHICQVYALHGRDTRFLLKRGPLPVADVKILTRQVLQALVLIHSRGLIHSDIKPGNVLWCERTREARVIDLGNTSEKLRTGSAIGTRDYCPPEMLIGNPMTPAVDLWELGCSVFEWLTAVNLFDPWEICHQKYREFSSDDDDTESAPPDEDDLEEEREQVPAGSVLSGKYRLLDELGRGKCATVWIADQLHAEPLHQTLPARDEVKAAASKFRKKTPPRKGYDIYEVVMGYEHLLQMQQLLGQLPERFARSGRYHHLFYGPDGNFRFDPVDRAASLKELLAAKHHFGSQEALEIEGFLLSLLQFEPAHRTTAEEALRHPWLADVR